MTPRHDAAAEQLPCCQSDIAASLTGVHGLDAWTQVGETRTLLELNVALDVQRASLLAALQLPDRVAHMLLGNANARAENMGLFSVKRTFLTWDIFGLGLWD